MSLEMTKSMGMKHSFLHNHIELFAFFLSDNPDKMASPFSVSKGTARMMQRCTALATEVNRGKKTQIVSHANH